MKHGRCTSLLLVLAAAATLIAGWASDETSGRTEMLLATPLSRARWALSGGLGMFVNVAIFLAIAAVGIGIGVATADSDVATPVLGSAVLGLYGLVPSAFWWG